MLNSLLRWWDLSRQRIDLAILWPATKRQSEKKTDEEALIIMKARDMPESSTPQLSVARYAFILHMKYDPAWKECKEWSADQLGDFIEEKLV